MKWWLYASSSTHKNCRVNIGGMMSIGAEFITSSSWKQKINRRISMDNNLIRVNDMMVPVLWKLYFIQGKGYIVERNMLFQDYHSTMRLMLDGNKSSLNRTKKINVRHLFVRDVINGGGFQYNLVPLSKCG